MTAILLKFLGPIAPYLAAGALVLGLLGYVAWLRHDLAAATAANTVLELTNQADTVAIAAYQKQQAAMNAALQTLDTQTQTTDSAAAQISTSITAALPGDNGAVAPVLSKALASLSALQASMP